MNDNKQRIIDLLKQYPGGLKAKDISKKIGSIDKTTVNQVLYKNSDVFEVDQSYVWTLSNNNNLSNIIRTTKSVYHSSQKPTNNSNQQLFSESKRRDWYKSELSKYYIPSEFPNIWKKYEKSDLYVLDKLLIDAQKINRSRIFERDACIKCLEKDYVTKKYLDINLLYLVDDNLYEEAKKRIEILNPLVNNVWSSLPYVYRELIANNKILCMNQKQFSNIVEVLSNISKRIKSKSHLEYENFIDEKELCKLNLRYSKPWATITKSSINFSKSDSFSIPHEVNMPIQNTGNYIQNNDTNNHKLYCSGNCSTCETEHCRKWDKNIKY